MADQRMNNKLVLRRREYRAGDTWTGFAIDTVIHKQSRQSGVVMVLDVWYLEEVYNDA